MDYNPSLVGMPYLLHELGFEFQPMKKLVEITPQSLAVLQKESRKYETDSVWVFPLRIFQSADREALCFVSALKSPQGLDFGQMNAIYQHNLQSKKDLNILKKGSYVHNQISFYQITAQDSTHTHIHLTGYVKPEPKSTGHRQQDAKPEIESFVINYIVPNHTYQQYLKGIESSIASIKILR